MSDAWTVARARNALNVAAFEIHEAAKLLEGVLAGLAPPADIADRQEGRLPYDVTTDLLATIEWVLADDLWPAVANLQRSAQATKPGEERAMPAKPRRYTVTNHHRDGRNGPVPELRLSGRWMERAGFIPGLLLAVQVKECQLVVTVIAAPRPLPKRGR